MADVPRMTEDERREATVAALKRERAQHARRVDEVGVRRVAEIDAELDKFGAKDAKDEEPHGRTARQRRTTEAG